MTWAETLREFGKTAVRRIPHMLGAVGLFVLLWAVFPADNCGIRTLLTLHRCPGVGVAARAWAFGLMAGAIWVAGELAIWKIRRQRRTRPD